MKCPAHRVVSRTGSVDAGLRKLQTVLFCALMPALLSRCTSSGGAGPGLTAGAGGSGQGSGGAATGGSAPAAGKGGAGALPGTGGSGAGMSTTGTGGTTVGGSTGGIEGGAGAAGALGAGGTTHAAGGSGTGGSAGGASGPGTGGGVGNSSGGGGSAGIVIPPVRDTASKVPVSPVPGPGYTVEANYPYGPATAQRIDVLYPSTAGPKGNQVLPVVLMFHGGAWIHSYNNGSGKDHMTTFSDRFLAHGFMVCNAEYRVSDGSADAAPAPAAVEDALLAAKWCWDYMDYYHGDRTKYVVTGASAGGHLALMVGMTTPAGMLGPTSPTDYKIAAIVSGYGPADIEAEINGVAAAWLPASLPNRLAIAKQVNPMTYVRKDIPPLIVVQGADDHTAPVADSQNLVNKLVAAGADASIHLVPGAGHGFTAGAEWDDAEKAMFDWLVAHGIGK
ncbi:MAG: alpha/beta hydrolase [Verrucomicrobiota bacterium]